MTSFWRPAYVAIGSNLNHPQTRVLEAFERLATLPATRSVVRSRLYKTQPMGPQDQPYFVNAAAGLLTQLTARELLEGLLGIEQAATDEVLGRRLAGGGVQNGSRRIERTQPRP